MLGGNLLQGKTAIVTGGAQGLGLGIAQRLADFGASLALLDLQADKATAAAQTLRGAGHVGLYCDITDSGSRLHAVEQALATLGHIDILVNNAGIQYHSPAEELDETRWHQIFDVNVHAMMFMCRDVGQHMLAQATGSIINIGSISSLLAMPRRIPYVTTKTAVLGITRTLAVEWAGRGIRVNSIGPGYHKTPLFVEYAERGAIDEDRILKRIPMGKLGSIDAIGDAAVFFASPLSEYVTGQHLMVDGGYTVFGAPEDAS